jgi:hypothetical protein
MKINVLGFTYNVVRGYIPVAGVGLTDHIKQTITLDPDLDYEHTVETLLHEILHCVEFAVGLDLKEPEVHCLSRGLYSVLTDPQNEMFWAALAGSDELMEEEEGYVAIDPDEVLEVWGNGDPIDCPFDNGDDLQAPSTYTGTRTDGY